MPRYDAPIILTGHGFSHSHIEKLRSAGLTPIHFADGTEVAKSSIDAVGYVLGGDERINLSVLATMPRLRAISFVGSGIQQFVDCKAARARNIALMRTPGPMVDAVAEHTIGLLIGLQRGLFGYNQTSKLGVAVPSNTLSLSDARIGLIGLGPIGFRVAEHLHSMFGCRLKYWSRTRKYDAEIGLKLEYSAFDEILSQVDCAIILLAATPETCGIINKKVLSSIREPIGLINTAAAELVDPDALCNALEDGRVFAAAFDGYWQEPLPLPGDDPFGLLSYPDSKFIVTPHVAAKSTRAWPRMIDMAVDNLVEYLGG